MKVYNVQISRLISHRERTCIEVEAQNKREARLIAKVKGEELAGDQGADFYRDNHCQQFEGDIEVGDINLDKEATKALDE